ncbi:SIMPL domain-containing protein [Streptomyces lunaelactis]|uniref:SIMPL domain-containing protein n=1 Tax=Streptomyces lunaelactis TaxID=1535768 RepID=UPI001585491A|nr:SIMPL domain-containing protein [Streptomyces lunaelactis]NUK07895.1 SIMPL domain-containing protein [Streptomyces lunaelactis]NUK49768.1 SIMPL domain-containing protein [Streptomyces lunaelactis]NUK67205.1 SIMPL domain-containing protein [Streptomyces lunaelactis]NUL22122.1 SIMPL domain-containing protein [Streptomyces lunaelactis]
MTTDAPTNAAPYGTPETPRVAVRGEARLEFDPEIARIGVVVSARGTDRRSALEDLTRRNAAVLDLIKSYGESVEKLETGAFSISPELTRHGRGERVRAYHGRVNITAELADFTALGELTTRLADLELTRVDGPWWALRPDSPAHGEARRQAVKEAVQRAREYAEALGAQLAALVELADLGAERAETYPVVSYGAPRGAAYGGDQAESAPALDLEPQRQTVYAQVNARFTMTPPQL